MSRQGMIIARQYAEDLPSFDSREEAERVLLSQRDAVLSAFVQEIGSELVLDYTFDSLKALEKWYIEGGRPETGKSGFSMVLGIGFYFGEVLCRQADFQWFVAEYFLLGGRYQIGVKRPLLSFTLTFGLEPDIKGNKRMQSLWRMARRLVGP